MSPEGAYTILRCIVARIKGAIPRRKLPHHFFVLENDL
jgi:hypothetical protein